MDAHITQCPYCQSAFRVSSAQLQLADGQVRCGACLNVFAAAQHFLSDEEVSGAGTETEAQQASLFEQDGGRPEPLLYASRSSHFNADLQEEERFSEANRAALHDVSASVELDSTPRQADPRRIMMAAALAAMLLALLGLQYLWFNRESLSMQADWRPRVELMCRVLPCTLPPHRDLAAISSENLVVRSHPEQREALLVSLNFRNEADFAQPFPTLTLRFTDSDQRAIAMRRFTPREYLQDQLRNVALMPSKATVQARVEIVDPGPEAINYEVFLGYADD